MLLLMCPLNFTSLKFICEGFQSAALLQFMEMRRYSSLFEWNILRLLACGRGLSQAAVSLPVVVSANVFSI